MNLREKLLPTYRALVLQALCESAGDQTAAAKALGVHRNTLARLVADCGIDVRQLRANWESARLIAEKKAEEPLNDLAAARVPAPRYRLPQNRAGITHKFTVGETKCYLTVNCYPDGTPGELFIKFGKVYGGEPAHGWADAFSIAFSMLLQQGTPLRALTDKFRAIRFEPAGLTSNQEIKFVTSVLDYVMRWMEKKYELA